MPAPVPGVPTTTRRDSPNKKSRNASLQTPSRAVGPGGRTPGSSAELDRGCAVPALVGACGAACYAPPDERLWRLQSVYDMDLRHTLSSIRAPTLVINRRDRRTPPRNAGTSPTTSRPRNTSRCPGPTLLFFTGDAGAVIDAIEEFLTGQLAPRQTDRALATVLFTDLVDLDPASGRGLVTDAGESCSSPTTCSSPKNSIASEDES